MDQLAAMRGNVGTRATYDADAHLALINTAKYAALHDMLWQAFVPENQKVNARLDFAAKALLYTKFVCAVWSGDCITSCEVGTGYPEHWFCRPGYSCLQEKCLWLWGHSKEIDQFAAEGTHPTQEVMKHHDFMHGATPKTTSALRNLHRLKDAVTLAAYWTVMQDYESLGYLLMQQRLRKTVCSQLGYTLDDLGWLGDLPVSCLDNIHKCLYQ